MTARPSEPAPLYAELAEAPAGGRAFWIVSGERRLRAALWPGGARGTALIFTGRTEYIEKYGRVIGELTARGFSVAMFEWRGQGLSDRALPDRTKGHVDDFAEYQEDIRAFLAAPEVAAPPGKRLLICHSMGGIVGMRALIEGTVKADAAVFSAPMLAICFSWPVRVAVKALVGLLSRLGMKTRFPPAPGLARPYMLRRRFEGNRMTGDADHYEFFRRQLTAEPALGLGAPTIGWVGAALREEEALAAAPAPETPILMPMGTAEAVVSPKAIRAFAAKAPDCRLVEAPGGRHEPLFETPEIRAQLWREIDLFLEAHGF